MIVSTGAARNGTYAMVVDLRRKTDEVIFVSDIARDLANDHSEGSSNNADDHTLKNKNAPDLFGRCAHGH